MGFSPSDDRYDEGLVMRAVAAKVVINSIEFEGEVQFASGGAAWKKAIRLPEMFDAGSSVTVELRSIACRRVSEIGRHWLRPAAKTHLESAIGRYAKERCQGEICH
jgi:hypothetical protein